MVRRSAGLDTLRGLGIIIVVFMHSALFQFKNIMDIDFNNPPLVVTIMGFLLMWAGLFAIISMMANTITSLNRAKEGEGFSPQRSLTLSGLFIFGLSFVYFMFLGPALLNFEGGPHQYSLVQALMKGAPLGLNPDRFFYVNALTMMGMNLLLLAPVLNWLLKVKRTTAHYLGLMGAVLGVLLLSLLRLPLYPVYQELYNNGNYLVSFFLGLLVNKNNPILPFLAFGLLGILLALWLFESPRGRKNSKYIAGLGVGLLVAAVIGLKLLPDTMLERDIDMFWYFLMIMQMGLFTLLTTGVVSFFDLAGERGHVRARGAAFLRRFGMVSLTVFLLETPLGELTASVWSLVYPAWNESMNTTFIYAGVNVLVWALILVLWQRVGYKYSVEWLSAKLYACMGRKSAKGEILAELAVPNKGAA